MGFMRFRNGVHGQELQAIERTKKNHEQPFSDHESLRKAKKANKKHDVQIILQTTGKLEIPDAQLVQQFDGMTVDWHCIPHTSNYVDTVA